MRKTPQEIFRITLDIARLPSQVSIKDSIIVRQPQQAEVALTLSLLPPAGIARALTLGSNRTIELRAEIVQRKRSRKGA